MKELCDGHVAPTHSDRDLAVINLDADFFGTETVDARLETDEHHLKACFVMEVVEKISQCLIYIISFDRLVHSTETLQFSYACLEQIYLIVCLFQLVEKL